MGFNLDSIYLSHETYVQADSLYHKGNEKLYIFPLWKAHLSSYALKQSSCLQMAEDLKLDIVCFLGVLVKFG